MKYKEKNTRLNGTAIIIEKIDEIRKEHGEMINSISRIVSRLLVISNGLESNNNLSKIESVAIELAEIIDIDVADVFLQELQFEIAEWN